MHCWSLVAISGHLHYFLYNITGRLHYFLYNIAGHLQWSLAGVVRIDLMSDKYITSPLLIKMLKAFLRVIIKSYCWSLVVISGHLQYFLYIALLVACNHFWSLALFSMYHCWLLAVFLIYSIAGHL